MNNLSQKIKKRRQDLGLTQADLAVRIDKKRSWIAKIETGRQRLFAEDLIEISRALEISLEELTGSV